MRRIAWALFGIVAFVTAGCMTTETPSRTGTLTVTRDQDLLLNANSADGLKRRVLVLDLQNQTELAIDDRLAQVSQRWIAELNRGQRFAIVRPQDLSDKKLNLAKPIDSSALMQQLSGSDVQMVLLPELQNLTASRMSDPVGIFRQVKTRFTAQIRLRLITQSRSKVLFDRVREVEIEDAGVRVGQDSAGFLAGHPAVIEKLLVDTLNEFTPQYLPLVERVDWEGRIAMINGDRLFLNVGQISGVQIGDLLRVYEEGPEVYDPQTGHHIGRTPGRVKGTLEVVSYFGKDGAIAILHSGGGFRESDRVGKFE